MVYAISYAHTTPLLGAKLQIISQSTKHLSHFLSTFYGVPFPTPSNAMPTRQEQPSIFLKVYKKSQNALNSPFFTSSRPYFGTHRHSSYSFIYLCTRACANQALSHPFRNLDEWYSRSE